MVLMAGVMGAGMCAPVMAGKKQVNLNAKGPIATFGETGLKQFKAGVISGLIKIPLTIFLANKLIIPNKMVALGITFPLLTLLESFILRKILSDEPKGLPLSSIFTSIGVSFLPLVSYMKNPHHEHILGPLSMKMGDALVKTIGWLFSGSAPAQAPTAVQAAVQTIAPGAQ